MIPHGTPEDVAAIAAAHREAGADHVAFQPLGAEGIPAEDWRQLAAAMR